jgi:hypothetical protein
MTARNTDDVPVAPEEMHAISTNNSDTIDVHKPPQQQQQQKYVEEKNDDKDNDKDRFETLDEIQLSQDYVRCKTTAAHQH